VQLLQENLINVPKLAEATVFLFFANPTQTVGKITRQAVLSSRKRQRVGQADWRTPKAQDGRRLAER